MYGEENWNARIQAKTSTSNIECGKASLCLKKEHKMIFQYSAFIFLLFQLF